MATRIFKTALAVIGLFFLFLGLFLFWAVSKNLPTESSLDIQTGNQIVLAPKDQITILTYNIGHGQGIKNEPTDWRDEIYTRQKMTGLTNVIKQANPDLVTLQEVDLDSNRTHYINQAEWIAQGANYPTVACAVVWDENYIPFPYWPIKHHLGKTKTANCIKPRSNAFWYNWAYLKRGVQAY